MASEMVERVGTAINHAATYGVRRNAANPRASQYEIFSGDDAVVIEAYDDYDVAAMRADIMSDESRARAAIEAMIEPTLEMQNAAWRWFDLNGYTTEDIEVAPPYRAMIAEALTEPASPAVRREGE